MKIGPAVICMRLAIVCASFFVWRPSATLNAGTLVPTYGTYFGGSGNESATAVVTDTAGNVIIVGTTTSSSLPGTASAFQQNHAIGFPNNIDVFIAKFDPSGKHLIWATFLGGNTDDTLKKVLYARIAPNALSFIYPRAGEMHLP
jgi:hypothetical protein